MPGKQAHMWHLEAVYSFLTIFDDWEGGGGGGGTFISETEWARSLVVNATDDKHVFKFNQVLLY